MKSKKYPKDIIEMDNRELQYATDPNWESYCGACDFFGKEECPHLNEVDDINNWKTEIKCENFYD